jgi:hypothetical protein
MPDVPDLREKELREDEELALWQVLAELGLIETASTLVTAPWPDPIRASRCLNRR